MYDLCGCGLFSALGFLLRSTCADDSDLLSEVRRPDLVSYLPSSLSMIENSDVVRALSIILFVEPFNFTSSNREVVLQSVDTVLVVNECVLIDKNLCKFSPCSFQASSGGVVEHDLFAISLQHSAREDSPFLRDKFCGFMVMQ